MTTAQLREQASESAELCKSLADNVRELRKAATAIDEWDEVTRLTQAEQWLRWAANDLERITVPAPESISA